jgi:iron complex outermembrane receptor protein
MSFKTPFLALFAGSFALVSFAADKPSLPQSPVLEELVVSEFRQTPAIDVNTSLTQLNQAEIEDFSLQHFEELVQLVPNMNYSGEGSRARYFQIRGIGELEQYQGAPNPSVGFIIDDIDLSGIGGIATTFDLQQVDVLRGPQATRFGASALAGMVYAQSAAPSKETSINSQGLLGSDGQVGVGVALGGSLSDNLQGRISAHSFSADGFRDNVYLRRDDTNSRDELNLRGKLAWQITDDWQATVSGLYADFQNGYDAWAIDNGSHTYSDKPGDDSQKTSAASVKLTGSIGAAVDFVSITSYAASDIVFSYDADWGNNDGYWGGYVYDYFSRTDRERSSATQEFRFQSSEDGRVWGGSTDWLVGLHGRELDEKSDSSLAGFYDDSVDGPGAFCPGGCDEKTRLKSDYDSASLAVFGKLDSALSEHWQLTAGLRFERWEADYSDTFFDYVYAPSMPVSNAFEPKENMWGGDLTLSYALTDTSNLYGLIARGYKAGGFNVNLARNLVPGQEQTAADIPYDPEYLLNYELGYKGLWFGGRLMADVSLFYMDRKDMQIKSGAQITPGDPDSFVFVTSNGKGSSYGLETTVAWQFTDSWQVFGALGLLQSKVESDKFTPQEELVGREFAYAPPYTFSIGTSYRSQQGWFGRLDVLGKGAFYYDYSHNRKSKAYQIVNLKLGKEWQRWAVYAWGRNIFDNEYYTRGFYFGNEPPAFPETLYTKFGDPRTYGMTVNYSF